LNTALNIETEAGVTLRVSGSLLPDRDTIVFSNSIGADMTMWDDQLAAAMEYANVVRYDQRGHGASSAPEGPYSIAQLGQDVIGILDSLRLSKVFFCGLSLGGITGMWLAVHHPKRFHGFVLANTAASFPVQLWQERCATARSSGLEPLVDATLTRWFTKDWASRNHESISRVRAMILRTSPEGYAGCGEALAGVSLESDLDQISSPVRVIAGRYDRATPPERSEEIAKAIPCSDLVTLDAAHVSPIEAASTFSAILREFVVTHSQTSASAMQALPGCEAEG
jgi:3-oxoadipate enol-lactonase